MAGRHLSKKTLAARANTEPLACFFCASTNIDGERGECLDCGTASAEMLAKLWTGKSRLHSLSHTISNRGAVAYQSVTYDGANRFSGG